jgi:hypothetical protein
MRAHTITTKARGGGKGRRKRTIARLGILALSLAVVLVAVTASTGSTTPTAPTLPLTLDLRVRFKVESPSDRWYPLTDPGPIQLKEELHLRAETSNDSTLVVGGDFNQPRMQLAAGEPTRFSPRFKQSKWHQFKGLLCSPPRRGELCGDAGSSKKLHGRKLLAKLEVKATDEFGQTVAEEYKLKFRCGPRRPNCPQAFGGDGV